MPRPIFDQIITANALLEGDVVYFTAADTWTRDIQQAEVFSDEANAQVRLIEAMAQANVIVGAYLMPIQHIKNGHAPTHLDPNPLHIISERQPTVFIRPCD